ncbi:MAG TPA: methyl-accepting chemotaxis protein [Verrucomicrobiae bacterium]|nr:methyl-accepting chemotaxis protein [Verrucomicrobiae bacterium]
MFQNLKLTPKIAGAIAAILTLTSLSGFLLARRRIDAQSDAAFIDKLRKTDGMATSVRVYFSKNLDLYNPTHTFTDVKQVPVVVAWTIARKYAESQGMSFSTPSLHPRDPAHSPDDFERDALEAFAKDPDLAEYYRRTKLDGQDVLRYAQPVRLTQDCLQCHGGPAGEKDPFGYAKEGMNVGDLRGAFVVTAPAGPLLAQARGNSLALLLTSLLMLASAVVVVLFVVRRFIVKPVSAAASLASEIARHNLAVRDIDVDSHDEVGEAVQALNSMKNNLHGMVSQISLSSDRLASAGEEINRTALHQVGTAQTQTDRTNEVAVAMEEMSATVSEVSSNTQMAAELARDATNLAVQGGKVVQDAVSKMRAIASSVGGLGARIQQLGDSSRQIGEIVRVIEDIADQTNLLALNAAIEAARAGEQGRGFAVVADEVRRLAERTSQATQEIATRIGAIQSETASVVTAMHGGTAQVEEGVECAARAGGSLEGIIRMNDQVRDRITQIATATTAQSTVAHDVSSSVADIANLAKGSVHASEESAKACEELASLAIDLEKLVRQFTLSTASRSAAPRPPQFQLMSSPRAKALRLPSHSESPSPSERAHALEPVSKH